MMADCIGPIDWPIPNKLTGKNPKCWMEGWKMQRQNDGKVDSGKGLFGNLGAPDKPGNCRR
jgi:hypothetical protein